MSTIGAGEAPPVAVALTRGDVVEAVHRAHIAVVDQSGSVVAWSGDPEVVVVPRSTLKPLFAVGMRRLGFTPEDDRWLALSSSSHSGEDFHENTARDILNAAGGSPEDLRNTADWPFEKSVQEDYIARGLPKSQIRANCSGKHSAMISVCRMHDWNLANYLQPEHPLQLALADTVRELVHDPLVGPLVDGCGAPVWAMPLAALARGFAALVGSDADAGAVGSAMRSHPEYVGGSHRDVTELMRTIPGLVAKDGADAVYCAGLPDGRGVAIKVEDGGGRARPPVIAATLMALGYPAALLAPILNWEQILGGGEPAGEVLARVALREV